MRASTCRCRILAEMPGPSGRPDSNVPASPGSTDTSPSSRERAGGGDRNRTTTCLICSSKTDESWTGSGNPWVMADVAAKDGRIAAVGRLGDAASETVVDASGRIVCPGFVDGHSHSDLYVLAAPESRQKIMQGFTTGSRWVGRDVRRPRIRRAEARVAEAPLLILAGNPGIPWNWNSMGDYLDAVDTVGASVNICSVRLRFGAQPG